MTQLKHFMNKKVNGMVKFLFFYVVVVAQIILYDCKANCVLKHGPLSLNFKS